MDINNVFRAKIWSKNSLTYSWGISDEDRKRLDEENKRRKVIFVVREISGYKKVKIAGLYKILDKYEDFPVYIFKELITGVELKPYPNAGIHSPRAESYGFTFVDFETSSWDRDESIYVSVSGRRNSLLELERYLDSYSSSDILRIINNACSKGQKYVDDEKRKEAEANRKVAEENYGTAGLERRLELRLNGSSNKSIKELIEERMKEMF